jgi:transcriptional regulator with XRE-family HTH domain
MDIPKSSQRLSRVGSTAELPPGSIPLGDVEANVSERAKKTGAAKKATRPVGSGQNGKADYTVRAVKEQSIGARVHFLRQQRNITLEELSSRSGLTKSFVSKVERGISVPSISTAKSLAGSFGLTVSQLLGEDNSDNSVCLVRKEDRPSFMKGGEAGGYDYEMMAAGKQYKRMEPYIMRPPMRFQDGRKFDHLGEEFMFVLTGSIEVELGGKSYELNSGDSLYFDSHFSHRTRSLGRKNAEVLVVITAQPSPGDPK